MNQYQQCMFDQAEALIASSDTFYRQDFTFNGTTYAIYNYRLASYTEFERPGGREMRGHMFAINEDGTMHSLASLPMSKFHNLNECPLTMNLDLNLVDSIELKADGSLMSTFINNDQLYFKSKGSLNSEQAVDSNTWIRRPENAEYYQALYGLTSLGYTANLEWCAPHNRIVIGYQTAHLKLLNVRSRIDGTYIPRVKLESMFGKHLIECVTELPTGPKSFIEQVPEMLEDIEGYIARIGDLWFKIKTNKYVTLHHCKDSVTNPRRLFEVVLEEGVDDLRGLFAHDRIVISLIDEMEAKVGKLYNSMVAEVERYHDANQHLTQKEYAIKAQSEVTKLYFGLVMDMYVKRVPQYKKLMLSKYKELGFRDTSLDKKEE